MFQRWHGTGWCPGLYFASGEPGDDIGDPVLITVSSKLSIIPMLFLSKFLFRLQYLDIVAYIRIVITGSSLCINFV